MEVFHPCCTVSRPKTVQDTKKTVWKIIEIVSISRIGGVTKNMAILGIYVYNNSPSRKLPAVLSLAGKEKHFDPAGGRFGNSADF